MTCLSIIPLFTPQWPWLQVVDLHKTDPKTALRLFCNLPKVGSTLQLEPRLKALGFSS